MTALLASSTYASLVRPLQFLVLLAISLFFLRVTYVATQSMREPREPGESRRSRRRPLGLAFIEPDDRKGEFVEVLDAVVLGRGADCDVPLHDSFLSTRHARLQQEHGDLVIEDLGSTNGTYVNQELVKGRVQLVKGDIVQVGNVLFEVAR